MSSATQSSYRKYSARIFSRRKLSCPHCRAEFEGAPESCPECEFDLELCQKAFPFAAPPLSLIIDPSKLLPAGVEKSLAGPYKRVRKRVPQIDFSFCFVRLQPQIAIQDFAFWLHNCAPEAAERRAWQILVVGDLVTGRLALTPGYAVEPFVKARYWEAALQELAAGIAEKNWNGALGSFLDEARELLESSWQVATERRIKTENKEKEEPTS